MLQDPISRIEWRDAVSLSANEYNPNVVFTPELKLLEKSILKTGWVQPILITQDGTIIDGFHRHRLAQDSVKLRDKYKGQVPCAVMDITPVEAMIVTIRMNRAKGSHVAVRMSEIVRKLVDQMGVLPEELAQDIGATKAEIDLLYQEGVFKMKNIKDYKYSKAWIPQDTRIEAKPS
jgi:ParB-like chromosome segregation protein Spo0J